MGEEKVYFVYILASKKHGTLYTGITSDLAGRVWQHKNNVNKGFTSKYNVHKLVWYEVHNDVEAAIIREKRIKRWCRAWKISLIEEQNLDWVDLYPDLNKPRTPKQYDPDLI